MTTQYEIAHRELGQFPLSIATSLAFEGAIGIYPERDPTPNVLPDYSELWVNLRTLFRNLMGSLQVETRNAITAGSAAQTLMEEIGHLDALVSEKTNGGCKIVYYVSNYDGVRKKFPHAISREPKTDRQRIYAAIQTQTIQALLKMLGHAGARDVRVFPLYLSNPKPKKTLILTHYAFDLLSDKEFAELDLLESHTGVIKPKSQWYTKMQDGKELPMIPFREVFLQVFGDSELFHPWPIKTRKEIIEMAKGAGWTQITSDTRVRYHIDMLKNPYLKTTLKEMM